MSPEFDLLIKNVRVVRPHGNTVHAADIAVRDGQVALIAPGIEATRAKALHDGRGRLAFPGVVDAHMHAGIYAPLQEDAISESKAAAMGGVTSSLTVAGERSQSSLRADTATVTARPLARPVTTVDVDPAAT